MVEPENKMLHRSARDIELATEQRLKALAEMGLLADQTVPVFEEATQTTAHLLEIPICILGFVDHQRHWFKSAVGLSQLGLMNQLAQTRQLPRQESICTYVIENHQVLAINDALSHPTFANSMLVQRYGIRAYLGVPLINATGLCLGAISVMDLEPRQFTIQQIKFLELMARWSMSEFERNQLLQLRQLDNGVKEDSYTSTTPVNTASSQHLTAPVLPTLPNLESPAIVDVKLDLLEQLTQELKTPLTSILGMANVVCREIYGPLTNKQKEYLEIILNSGRHLLSLINEISYLGSIQDRSPMLNLTAVDIEMLCQQVTATLEEAANRREQQIRLSLEHSKSRTWVIDKEKVKQLLYHLISCIMQAANTGSIIRLHVSHKSNGLNFSIAVSHPWLGEGLVPVDPQLLQLSGVATAPSLEAPLNNHAQRPEPVLPLLPTPSDLTASSGSLVGESQSEPIKTHNSTRSYEHLRLLLSYELIKLHGGKISLQGTPELGYRYVVTLPELVAPVVNN